MPEKKKQKPKIQKRKRKTPLLPDEIIIPNPKDLGQLRTFFDTYGSLPTYRLAQVVGLEPSTIMSWRRKLGFRGKSIFKNNTSHKRDVPRVPKEIWDNREWFKENYEAGYGMTLLSRMTGISPPAILYRLRKYKIEIRKPGTSNPFCNAEWLKEHYIDKKMSLPKCAEIAGVSDYTIIRWLIKFGMRSRSRGRRRY